MLKCLQISFVEPADFSLVPVPQIENFFSVPVPVPVPVPSRYFIYYINNTNPSNQIRL